MLYVSGRLAPEDYLKALYLHDRPSQSIVVLVPLVIAGYLLAVLLYGLEHFSVLEVTVLVFPLFVTAMWRIVMLPEQIRANFYADVTLSDRYEFTMTPEQLCISSSLEVCELRWSDLSHYKWGQSLTLVYRSKGEFYVFPARWFESREDVHFFRNRLQEALGPPQW